MGNVNQSTSIKNLQYGAGMVMPEHKSTRNIKNEIHANRSYTLKTQGTTIPVKSLF